MGSEKRKKGEGVDPGSLRLLLAEDNPINQAVAAHFLREAGHQLEVVENGRLAVEAFERGGFDLVLMDVKMPEMDGYAATAAIREREGGGGARTPIIAMTAQALEDDLDRCYEVGMDGIVTKPVDAGELRRAIERFAPPRPAGAEDSATAME